MAAAGDHAPKMQRVMSSESISTAASSDDEAPKVRDIVPLFPLGEETPHIVNFVCAIPKGARSPQTVQDGKHSKGDIFFNYGCLPRTRKDADAGCPGDDEPLDACEIGMRRFATGEVRRTKVLGVLSMTEEDDRKLIVIDEEDRWADELDDVDDVEDLLPGVLDEIREFYRAPAATDAKAVKPVSMFAVDSVFMSVEFAIEDLIECHTAWTRPSVAWPLPVQKDGLPTPQSSSKFEDFGVARDQPASGLAMACQEGWP